MSAPVRGTGDVLYHDLSSVECPECKGAGIRHEVIGRDYFGTWETKEWPCGKCGESGQIDRGEVEDPSMDGEQDL